MPPMLLLLWMVFLLWMLLLPLPSVSGAAAATDTPAAPNDSDAARFFTALDAVASLNDFASLDVGC